MDQEVTGDQRALAFHALSEDDMEFLKGKGLKSWDLPCLLASTHVTFEMTCTMNENKVVNTSENPAKGWWG